MFQENHALTMSGSERRKVPLLNDIRRTPPLLWASGRGNTTLLSSSAKVPKNTGAAVFMTKLSLDQTDPCKILVVDPLSMSDTPDGYPLQSSPPLARPNIEIPVAESYKHVSGVRFRPCRDPYATCACGSHSVRLW